MIVGSHDPATQKPPIPATFPLALGIRRGGIAGKS